jgi:DNA-binding transcriptional regulator YiaG
VLVDLQRHQILDLLPDRQKETAATWMKKHPEITHVSRDRGREYASAAAQGAPQAVEVADRFHIVKNLSQAVQQLLARVLTEMKEVSQADAAPGACEQKQTPHTLPMEEWRPAQDEDVKQAILTRRTERNERYQQIMALRTQGLTSPAIASRLGMKERTVRDWLQREQPEVGGNGESARVISTRTPLMCSNAGKKASAMACRLGGKSQPRDIPGHLRWSLASWKRSKPRKLCPQPERLDCLTTPRIQQFGSSCVVPKILMRSPKKTSLPFGWQARRSLPPIDWCKISCTWCDTEKGND